MLSESERRCLDEIEQRLCLEEPDLARALVVGKYHTPWLNYVVTGLFGALGIFLLVLGAVGPALACFGVAAVSMLLRGFTWH
jgi:hypothetical protein